MTYTTMTFATSNKFYVSDAFSMPLWSAIYMIQGIKMYNVLIVIFELDWKLFTCACLLLLGVADPVFIEGIAQGNFFFFIKSQIILQNF